MNNFTPHKATKKEIELIHSYEYNRWICFADMFDIFNLLWFDVKVIEDGKHITFSNNNFKGFLSHYSSEYSSEPWKLYFDRAGEFDKAWKCRYQFSIPENHYSLDFVCNVLSNNEFWVEFKESEDKKDNYYPVLLPL